MGVLPLPPYSPKPNPVENIWEEQRKKFIGNAVFGSMGALEDRLQVGLKHLEDHSEITKSISAWPWIIDAITIVELELRVAFRSSTRNIIYL